MQQVVSGMTCAMCRGKIGGTYSAFKVVPVVKDGFTFYVRVHKPDCPPEPSVRRG